MILKFPDLDTLRLALTSGAAPPGVAQAAAVAGFDDLNQVWVETAAPVPRAVQNDLRRLGVQLCKVTGAAVSAPVSCWPEILPLRRDADPIDRLEQTPVLFETATQDGLGRLVVEILRLGNDRQGFRWLESQTDAGDGRGLLRVVGPPYYSLLRAIDRNARADAPRAYRERAPRVWVEVGWTHPLAEHLKPPAGKLLLVAAPRCWTLIDEGPFRDVYEVMEFALPNAPAVWNEGDLKGKVRAALKLTPAGSADGAELWVLRDDPVMELNRFVQASDDQMLHRLAFAVGEKDGKAVIVLRVRHSKLPPPELVLKAEAYKPYLKLPNLFLPAGWWLHPPLRRDMVRKLLADDPAQVVWLTAAAHSGPIAPRLVGDSGPIAPRLVGDSGPIAPRLVGDSGPIAPRLVGDSGPIAPRLVGDSGPIAPRLVGDSRSESPTMGFRPETLPEDAFRPLIDWIDYVLDHEKEPLQAWIQAAQFDFEAFICDEDLAAKPKKPPPDPRRGGKKKDGGPDDGVEMPSGPMIEYVDKSRRPGDKKADEPEAFTVEKVEPSVLQQQLRELEERFTSSEGGLDAPERQAMWPALASLNAALGAPEEAGICWVNALWSQETISEEWAWQWFCTEAAAVPVRTESGARNRSWASRLSTAAGKGREIAVEDLDRLLSLAEPASADVRALAAYLVWSVRRESPPKALLQRLNPAQRFLETHEKLAPVRTVWLAWAHLVRLSRGDVLALARARDRLLERLFLNGVRPEQDLPGFLRFAGPATNQRFRGVGRWLRNLAERARGWIGRQGTTMTDVAAGLASKSTAYSDLLFAFGLARLGERDAALSLLRDAKAALAGQDDAHMILLEGFEYRIRQVLEGKAHAGPLPSIQMEYLEHLRQVRPPDNKVHSLGYVVDALRKNSRVLEPHQQVDPFLHALPTDDVATGRAALGGVTDRVEIIARVRALLAKTPKGPAGHRRRTPIYYSALDAAPRAGEEFAREMLTAVVENFDALIGPADPHDLGNLLMLLERALFVSAHFDSAEHIHAFVPRFRLLLETMRRGPGLKDFDRVAGQCFRGLRKLGMRAEVDLLLAQTAEIIQAGRADDAAIDDASLCSLLQVAGGWLYFGRDQRAESVLRDGRDLLLQNTLPYQRQTALACAYAAALGQAPIELAQKRLPELFDRLENIRDPLTTHPWYSQVQLRVIEAVVLAVANDDFTLGANARRWLDDDEYLMRRRIHKDYRALTAHA